MLFSNKKTRVERDVPPESQIKFEIEIKIKKTNTSYGNGSVIASLKIDENMILTTDAYLKEIKNEVESIIGSAYEKISNQIDNSPHLSDGFFKEKVKEEGGKLDRIDGGDNI